MIPLIRSRQKTQTRRPVDGKLPCRYRTGRCYRVQPGRGQPGVLTVTVLEARRERLGAISQQDARREGFRFVKQFEARWSQLHGSWTPDLDVWVITFEVGDLRDRFDQPRLLKATPGHAGEDVEEHQDYTARPHLAMRSEPEAVSPAALKAYTTEARRRESARNSRDHERSHARSLAIRLKDAEKRRDADALASIRGELELLEHQIRTAA